MKHLVVYHQDCPDGFGAAYMIRALKYHIADAQDREDMVRMVGMMHGDEPPDTEGYDTVTLVDFANVPLDWLAGLVDKHYSVVILDHHATAREHLYVPLSRGDVFTCDETWTDNLYEQPFLFVLDQERSGIGLAAAYCDAHGLSSYSILSWWPFIQDYDLWRFELEDTRAIYAAVTSHPYRTESWNNLAKSTIAELHAEGTAILRFRQQIIDTVTRKPFHLALTGAPGQIPCASAPYVVGSDVAHVLATQSEHQIGAYAIHHGNEVQIGLRSLENGPDVARIAEEYQGGGHVHAAGLRLPSWLFEELTY